MKNNTISLRVPQALKEFDYHKNGCVRPDEITVSSHRELYWRCMRGHSFERSPQERFRVNGRTGEIMIRMCPICDNREVLAGYNDLATTHPDIASEWNDDENELLPTQVTAGSNYTASWKCRKCNTTWKAHVYSRLHRGCPSCGGRTVVPGVNDLESRNPAVAAEFHPTLNGNMRPCDIAVNSHKKYYFQCENGHPPYPASPHKRNLGGTGCPYCAGLLAIPGETDLLTLNKALAMELCYTATGQTASKIGLYSNVSGHWKCSVCGHEWDAIIASRANGRGCPKCKHKVTTPGKNDLLSLFPELAQEWDYRKNKGKKPEDFFPKSNAVVYWICPSCHESYERMIYERVQFGRGCPNPQCKIMACF